ncbi:hypothetical protein IFM89_008459 [Coptis chinensis]|uniref:Uncharacterized protein n=1 Tax=Coptis chinensis TaxID=261450 RepID=A0A835IBY6_9MAGN|nr:hypothetical protein IFM89_008459 [Coptis chinensis]
MMTGTAVIFSQAIGICSIDIEKLSSRRTKFAFQPLNASPIEILEIYRGLSHHLLSEVNRSLCLTLISHHQLQMFVLEDITKCAWTKSNTISLQSLQNLPPFGSFVKEDACLVSMTGVDSSNLLDPIKVIGPLRKEQKLRKIYFFHWNNLISWS